MHVFQFVPVVCAAVLTCLLEIHKLPVMFQKKISEPNLKPSLALHTEDLSSNSHGRIHFGDFGEFMKIQLHSESFVIFPRLNDIEEELCLSLQLRLTRRKILNYILLN